MKVRPLLDDAICCVESLSDDAIFVCVFPVVILGSIGGVLEVFHSAAVDSRFKFDLDFFIDRCLLSTFDFILFDPINFYYLFN